MFTSFSTAIAKIIEPNLNSNPNYNPTLAFGDGRCLQLWGISKWPNLRQSKDESYDSV